MNLVFVMSVFHDLMTELTNINDPRFSFILINITYV
jgi:hypothetical protein